MLWLNIILTVVEFLSISFCLYYFLSHNERTIYLKRRWYGLMLTVFYGLLLFFANSGNMRVANCSAGVIIFGPALIGWIGFHKRRKALVFDLLYGGFMLLTIQGGIALGWWAVIGFQLNSRLILGNIMMFCKVILLLLFTKLLVVFMNGRVRGKISKSQLLTILILPGFSIFYFISLTIMNQVYVQLYGIQLLMVNIIALLIMNFYFLYLIHYQFRSHTLEQELLMYQKENEIRCRYYEELDEKYRESRKVLHDMKNHLQVLEELYKDKEPEAGKRYMKDLYHMLNVLGEQHYTQNKMLNIILNEKLRAARNKGIAVTVQIGDVDLTDIKEVDITTIFANLLDNAVEAAEEFGEGSFLSVRMEEIRDFRVVRISNAWEPGRKKEGNAHMGLGLENVRNTLERYHGSIKVEKGEKEFRVHLMLPGKETI